MNEKAKKILKAGGVSASVVTLFLYLHGDLKAEIKLVATRLGVTEDKVIMLETQEVERDRRFINAMNRVEKKLDKIDNKLDELRK